jgi:hypothetical protein
VPEAIIASVRAQRGRTSDLLRAACAVLAATAAIVACGGEDPPPPPSGCADDTPPEIAAVTQTAIRGVVTLRDRRDRTLDAGGTAQDVIQGRLSATFGDFSTVTSTPSSLSVLGPCVGVVSRPTSSGQVRRLDLEQLTVRGTALGDIIAMRASAGFYQSSEMRLFMPGAGSLTFVGTEMAGGFPAFEEAIEAVDTIALDAPNADAAELLIDPLELRWAAGDGDYVDVTISPEEMEQTGGGQLLCIVRDDGCFTIPSEANTFLLASQTERYTLSIQRHRYRALHPNADTTLELDVISEELLTLKNGVLGR